MDHDRETPMAAAYERGHFIFDRQNPRFRFDRRQSKSPTVKECLARQTEKGATHDVTSLFNGKFLINVLMAMFYATYARDSGIYYLSLVEKPQDRDYRPLVVDLDGIPPEIYRGGAIIEEIKEVFRGLLRECLRPHEGFDAHTPEVLEALEADRGEASFNRHLIWKEIVLKERTAKYITQRAQNVMKVRYPEYNWAGRKAIIDACVAGPNGLRMIASYKPYEFDMLRLDYPDIFRDYYKPDKSGNPTQNYNFALKYAYLLPDLDKGVYMPKGHVGPLTREIVELYSIILPPGLEVLDVKAECAADLEATVKKTKEPSAAQKRKNKRADKLQGEATSAIVHTIKEFLFEHGGHEGLHNTDTNWHGDTLSLRFSTTGFCRTCFSTGREHTGNGFYVRWGAESATYSCCSQGCTDTPKVMPDIHARHLSRLQAAEKLLSKHMTAETPEGWERITRDAEHVQPLAADLKKYKIVCVKAMMGMGKSTAVRAAIVELKPKSAIFLTSRKMYADSLHTELTEEGFAVHKYLDSIGPISADFVIVQMESLSRIHFDKVYDMVIIDESESCLKTYSSPTMKGIVPCVSTLGRLVKAADYVVALDAFLSTRTTMGSHLMAKGVEGLIIDYTHQPVERTGIFVPKVKTFVRMIVDKALRGERTYVFCSTLKKCREIEAELKKNNIKHIFYHAEMDEDVRATVKDVNTAWSEVTVVLTTPTITVGINYDVIGKFDSAFVFVSNWSCCPRDIMQGICRVRDYTSNRVYFHFTRSCKQQQSGVTWETVAAGVEESISRAENNVEEKEYWRVDDSVRLIVSVNQAEEQLKFCQMIPQMLAFFKMSGVRVSNEEEISLDDDDDDEDDEPVVPVKKPERVSYERIESISHLRANEIRQLTYKREATVGQEAEFLRYSYCYDLFLSLGVSALVQAAVFNLIYWNPVLRRKMYYVHFQAMNKGRYEAIDRWDREETGMACLSRGLAAQLRLVDEINRQLVGEEIGPTDDRAFLMTEDIPLDQERLKNAVNFVHQNKENIFKTFHMKCNPGETSSAKFGDKVQTFNHVLKNWGFVKIKPRQIRKKKVSRQEYTVESSIVPMSLPEIYSKINGTLFAPSAAERANNKRIRLEGLL